MPRCARWLRQGKASRAPGDRGRARVPLPALPNVPHDSFPDGTNEERVIRRILHLPVQDHRHTPGPRQPGVAYHLGSYREEERVLIRVHPFNKVELFQDARPKTSYAALDQIVRQAEAILQRLGLHYRSPSSRPGTSPPL